MSTRIVFGAGNEVIVAQDESDVVHAVRRDHPNPVALESTTGGPIHVNWNHIAFFGEVISGPAGAGGPGETA
jgi:hypothetical protein